MVRAVPEAKRLQYQQDPGGAHHVDKQAAEGGGHQHVLDRATVARDRLERRTGKPHVHPDEKRPEDYLDDAHSH